MGFYCFSEGRKHDAGMLADSGLLRQLERSAFSLAGQPMCVYGDTYIHTYFICNSPKGLFSYKRNKKIKYVN